MPARSLPLVVRRLALAAMVGLLLGTPLAAPARSATLCVADSRAAAPRDVPTLAVAVTAQRPTYRRGQTAQIPVQVRLGVAGGPKVAAAQVSVVLSIGSHVVKELDGQTDAGGRVQLRWPISTRAPLGALSAVATASVLVVDSVDCTGGLLYQSGQASADPLITVTA
jgi:hypothetical protein